MFCSLQCRDKTYKIYGDYIEAMIVYGEMIIDSNRILIDFLQAFGGSETLRKPGMLQVQLYRIFTSKFSINLATLARMFLDELYWESYRNPGQFYNFRGLTKPFRQFRVNFKNRGNSCKQSSKPPNPRGLLKFLKQNDITKMSKSIFDFDWNERENVEKFKMISLISMGIKKGIIPILTFTLPRVKQEMLTLINHLDEVINSNHIPIIYEHYQVAEQMCPELIHDGFTVSLFGSLINHSCMSNIDRVIVNNKIFFYASKPIKKGEQLLTNY
jgi:hypothetical protein